MNTHIDLHLHTKYSDGTDTPETLITALRIFGINTFAVCDHDTVEGCRAFIDIVPDDMKMINGIEFSCFTDFRKCHILGLNIEIANPMITDAVNFASALRKNKLQIRLEHLRKEHNIIFPEDDIEELNSYISVGKPHLGQLLVKYGYSDNISDAISKYLKFPVPNDRIEAKTAIEAIVSAGGIPVWAHPLGGEDERRLNEDEFEKQLSLLIRAGIQGLECYYSRYSDKDVELLLSYADKHRLLISGGSDYHGNNKNTLPGQLSAEFMPVDFSKLTILSKG